MPGAFGLIEDRHHHRVPLDLMVERNLRLSIWWLQEQGLLVDGAAGCVAFASTGEGPRPIREIEIRREAPNLWIDGTCALVTFSSPNEYVAHPYFRCPGCERPCRHLFLRDRIACRRCHKLDWVCRHLNRQTPGVARVARLRRRLGAEDTKPFSPLPPRRRGHKRAYYAKLCAQIAAEEARLIAYLGGIVYDLDRRLRGPRGKRRHDPTKAAPRPDTSSS